MNFLYTVILFCLLLGILSGQGGILVCALLGGLFLAPLYYNSKKNKK